MRKLVMAAALLVYASAAQAQIQTNPLFEIRPVVGAYLPTGEQQDYFKTAALYGVQTAVEVKPAFHLVGMFVWSPGHNKFQLSETGVNMFQYDVGAEFNMIRNIGKGWELKPFLGLGAGGRTYDYKAESFDTKTCAGAYGALGTELQYGAIALRLEGRDYVSCFKDPVLNESETRNDIGLSFGLAYHIGRRTR